MIVVPGARPPAQMRRINDLIRESLGHGGRREPIAFFCECADPDCYRSVWLTAAEYEAACADRRWRPLAAGHAGGLPAPGHRCADCGYGVARALPPRICPMCGSARWREDTRPVASV